MTSDSWPWTHLLPWPAPRGAERRLSLVADGDVRAQVRHDLGLDDLQRLDAWVVVRPWLDGMELQGCMTALVTRICGITLDPFDVQIDEPIEVRIVPQGSPNAPKDEGEIVIELDGEDPPDTAPNDGVDLSAYVVETLALALEPFPRKPGAVFASPPPAEDMSAFAALAKFVKRPPTD